MKKLIFFILQRDTHLCIQLKNMDPKMLLKIKQ